MSSGGSDNLDVRDMRDLETAGCLQHARSAANRFWSLYGAAEAARRGGNAARAQTFFQKLADLTEHADQPGRPELSEARDPIRQ